MIKNHKKNELTERFKNEAEVSILINDAFDLDRENMVMHILETLCEKGSLEKSDMNTYRDLFFREIGR